MRILVLGAGAIGGYFGGRLAEAGVDVTFLVRPQRAKRLAKHGLVIKSPAGDAHLKVKTIGAHDHLPFETDAGEPFDVVLVTCKAYDLDDAIETIAPHVDAGAIALPVLNGMAHIDRLRDRLGHGRVVAGVCQIPARMNEDGEIEHLDSMARMVFGRLHDQPNAIEVDPVLDALTVATLRAKFSSKRIDPIDQTLWDKWVMLATLAGMTTLMRGSIGAIMATRDGSALMEDFLQETIAVAAKSGYPPSAEYLAAIRKLLFDPNSSFTASMLRDLEAGKRVEAEHIIGDMLRRAVGFGTEHRLLRAAFCHLQTYEARQKKEKKEN
ncbi:MAG TPA: ketopantoate reductase family protein [Dongiaceae bacterium]